MSVCYNFLLLTNMDKSKTVKILNPDLGLDNDSIKAALTDIIASNIFDSEKGSLNKVKKAEILTVDRNKLF